MTLTQVHPLWRKVAFLTLATVGCLTYQSVHAAAPHKYFFDANLPDGAEITVSWVRVNNGGQENSGSSTAPDSEAVPVGDDSSLSYVFPSPVIVDGKNYVLVQVSPESPVQAGPRGETTTITATYALATCPENSAPTLAGSDYLIDDPCARWNGSALTLTVPITADDFSPAADDPDGDPVTVTVNVSEVTLTGLGHVEATVTLTATDDPSDRNEVGCEPLQSLSTSIQVKVIADLTFDFAGFDTPLTMDQPRVIKGGQTVPVKFRLYDCAGNEICDTAPNSIAVYPDLGGSPIPPIEDSGSSNSNDVYFRYGGTCGLDGTFIFNLSTEEGFNVGESYTIYAVLADGTVSPGATIVIGR